MWRSGTSLLYALLNQHPSIGLMYEDDLLLLWPLFIGGKAKRDWVARWEFWNSAPERHKIDFAGLVPQPTPKQALEFCYKHKGTAIWGSKSPNYYDSMTKLADIFPNARFIIIWRDLRGICGSVQRAGSRPSWFARMGMIHRTILGYREMKAQRDQLIERGMEVHELQYEALISDPESTMRSICEFLHVAFDRNMCSLKGADRSAIFDHSHHQLVNSSEIVPQGKKTDALLPRLQRKIARYTALWKDEANGGWPPLSSPLDTSNKPSLIERLFDRVIYGALKLYDQFIAITYCYAPISLLQSYRGIKRQPVPLKRAPTARDSKTIPIS
jgi:hypothetical protein